MLKVILIILLIQILFASSNLRVSDTPNLNGNWISNMCCSDEFFEKVDN